MSLFHPQRRRECLECSTPWWAERYISRPSTILALPHSTAMTIQLVAGKQEKIRRWEKYNFCPKCGSDRVKDSKI